MSVTIELRGARATVEGGRWTGAGWLARAARATLEPVPTDDPDPDLTHAERALRLLGRGRIVEHTAPEFVPGRVY